MIIPILLLSSILSSSPISGHELTGTLNPGSNTYLTLLNATHTTRDLIHTNFTIPVDIGSYNLKFESHEYNYPVYRVMVSDTLMISQLDSATGSLTTQKSPLVITGTRKEYYTPRASLNPLALLKSPMYLGIIIMVISLFAVPALMKWVDPEGMAEMERIKEEKKNA